MTVVAVTCRHCGAGAAETELRRCPDRFVKQVHRCMGCGREWVWAMFGVPVLGGSDRASVRF